MNKRYKRKEKYFFYRNIPVQINGCYAFRGSKVVVFVPTVEHYFKNACGVRAFIDQFLQTYKDDSNIPF